MVGEAHEMVRDFELVDRAYIEAWEFVLDQYDSRRVVVREWFNKLLEIEPITNDNQVRSFMNKFGVVIRGLKSAGLEVDGTFSKLVGHLMLKHLDSSTSRDFDRFMPGKDVIPNYDDVHKFIQARSFGIVEKKEPVSTDNKKVDRDKKFKTPTKPSASKSAFVGASVEDTCNDSRRLCPKCNRDHSLIKCAEFASITQPQRFGFAKSNHYCIRCLVFGHSSSKCRSNMKCNLCAGHHHVLLHREPTPEKNTPAPKDDASSKSPVPSTSPATFMSTTGKSVLLQTAVVKVKFNTATGFRQVLARVFLDKGSQTTLVSERFVKHNNVMMYKFTEGASLGGINGTRVPLNYATKLTLCSRYNNFEIEVDAGIIPKIPYAVVANQVHSLIEKHPHLSFAEKYMQYTEVDVFLGAEFYEKCILNNTFCDGGLTARNTQFGWVVSGAVQLRTEIPTSVCGLTTFAVQDQLRKFWEIEEVDIPKSVADESEQQKCVELVSQTLKRDELGRFEVRLPLKINRTSLGESRPKALSALKRVENKYSSELQNEYRRVFEEYVELNHMEEVDSSNIPQHSYYIPHRPVLKPTSTSTKLRIVFNASMPSSTGLSLNQMLYVGPTIQPDLVDILIRFRVHNVAFASDIVKMYRQIRVHEDDCDLQRIVWRSQGGIKDARLLILAFGLGPSSYIATKCLDVLGESIMAQNPAAGRAIKEDFVIDNLLTGAKTVQDALELQHNIHSVLERAHFPLRKYVSNSPKFLGHIPESFCEETRVMSICQKDCVSLLGMSWLPTDDSFAIQLKLREDRSIFQSLTKRLLLSEIARVYDPLGIVAPVTIRAKLMLQQVWVENKQWDDVTSPQLIENFIKYYNDIEKLQGYSVRRRYSKFDKPEHWQLVGFADASEHAYSAVVYVRTIDYNGDSDMHFAIARTRVAPRKQFKLTVPKLELQAAELLARLIKRVADDLKINSFFAFSDSTVVLGWLNGEIDRWTVFVQNCVRKIVNIIPRDRWLYVRSKNNPADMGTRGIAVEKLLDSEWLRGPEFVASNMVDLSVLAIDKLLNLSDLPEMRKSVISVGAVLVEQNDVSLLCRYSSFDKLVQITIQCLRFIRVCKLKCNFVFDVNYSNLDSRVVAINTLIKISQMYYFRIEIGCLENNNPLRKSSCIRKLVPFIDSNGVLRASTRLNNSVFSYDACNPVVLSAKCKLVYLIVKHVHDRYYHSTKIFIKRYMMSKYCIVGNLINVIKHVIRGCIVCVRYKREVQVPMMGLLPSSRVSVSRPFSKVGVDFCGPFQCKCVKHRSVTRYQIYAAVFVCFSTRAIHIEVVHDLSARALIDTLQRFAARRGIPSDIHSDNGTNFVGVSSWYQVETPQLQKFVNFQGIKWHFNPPRAPHHGGIWEAGVKSLKHHLLRVTNGQSLTYEEYLTVFANIECILNSRPLCYRGAADDAFIITPAHFLIGDALTNLPIPEPETTRLPLMKRYELLRSQIKSFWRFWASDYINSMRNRSKWTMSSPNVKIGDIVILQIDNRHPSDWPIGLVVAVQPGIDGVVRVADAKSGGKIYRRSVQKLTLVPSANS